MTQYKILVVDDNADIRELLEILLTSEGYAVTLASSGEQALQLLSPELDLVILDIMMPGISGIRVCEAIRKQSNVPVLFLTAKGQDEDISLGLRVGAGSRLQFLQEWHLLDLIHIGGQPDGRLTPDGKGIVAVGGRGSGRGTVRGTGGRRGTAAACHNTSHQQGCCSQ